MTFGTDLPLEWETGEKVQLTSAASCSPGGAAPVLMRWRRILRTCWGSVMTARTRIWEPQRVQRKGSTSYTFASSRAQAERDSLSDTD